MLGLQNEREWKNFCEQVLRQPELASDERFSSNSRRVAARRELCEIISRVFSKLSVEEVMARLDQAQIANARLNEMRDVWEHPQLKARGRWTQIDTPAGKIPALIPPALPATWEPRMEAVPALGEHTESILTQLGYDRQQIARLRAQQVI
jgi:itaconate CoA-transferase